MRTLRRAALTLAATAGATILAIFALLLLVPSCVGRRGEPYVVRNTTQDSLLVRTSNTGETFACEPGETCPAPAKNILESLANTTAIPTGGGRRLRPRRIDPDYRSPAGETIWLVEF